MFVETIDKELFWYPLKSNVIYGLEIAYAMLLACVFTMCVCVGISAML